MQFKLEHVAFNVSDPVAIAAWYERHLGLKIVRRLPTPHETHFLADSSGNVMLEIYNNPPEQVPDYAKMNPLQFHLAFVSSDPEEDRNALEAGGASFVEEVSMADGTRLVMMRDPWGVSLKLCKRAVPMLLMQQG